MTSPLHIQAIKEAVAYYNFKWPKELWTGVMWFHGFKITIEEFNDWARHFE